MQLCMGQQFVIKPGINKTTQLWDTVHSSVTHTHTPVSYTHLDVYKRQEYLCVREETTDLILENN